MDENAALQQQAESLQAQCNNIEASMNALAGELDNYNKQAGELISVIQQMNSLIVKISDENENRRFHFNGMQTILSAFDLITKQSSFMSVFSENMNSFVQGYEYTNMYSGLEKAKNTLTGQLKEIVDTGNRKISEYQTKQAEVNTIAKKIDTVVQQLKESSVYTMGIWCGQIPQILFLNSDGRWANITKYGPAVINGDIIVGKLVLQV